MRGVSLSTPKQWYSIQIPNKLRHVQQTIELLFMSCWQLSEFDSNKVMEISLENFSFKNMNLNTVTL
jgi:hypothetical protein